jgi:hypothetical protein
MSDRLNRVSSSVVKSARLASGISAIVLAAFLLMSGAFPRQGSASKSSIKAVGSSSSVAHKHSHRGVRSDISDPTEILVESARQQQEVLNALGDAPKQVKRKKNRSGVSIMAVVTHTVTTTTDVGPGSLRQAMINSNTDGMPSQIVFQIPIASLVGGVATIQPLSLLPPQTAGDAVIDGTTQTTSIGDTNPSGPEIVINGGLAPMNTRGLVLQSGNNTVKGLCINGFAGPGGTAVQLLGLTADHNTIVACYIGTDAIGATAVANGGPGIQIIGGSDSNQIGGTNAADRNILSGNRGGIQNGGVFLPTASSAGSNVIQGNYIGVDRTGTIAIPNLADGIGISGTTDNIIGGTAPGAGNVCSGNTANGVRLSGQIFDTTPSMPPDPDDMTGPYQVNFASGNMIQGNKCGTDASGTAAIANGIDGIRINNASNQNLVGGTAPGAANICSGNDAHGVHFDSVRPFFLPYTPVSQNTVHGNLIGTDASGTAGIGNGLPGVILFFGAIDNVIGGTNPGEGNIIAFNTGSTLPDGQGGFVNIPGAGVSVSYDPTFADPVLANDPTVNNRISGNSIHDNVAAFGIDGLGIDLNASGNEDDATDGITTNDAGDADDGGNRLQNFPVLTSVVSSGATTTITGTLNSAPGTTFSVEFFSNISCDPSGNGEGETYLGSTTVATDAGGNANFTATLPANIGCKSVTATATDPSGNTSEFSVCLTPGLTVSCSVGATQLWPPNHNLINVDLSATAVDNCSSSNPTLSVAVYSDEDDEAPTGDGNHSPDAKEIAPGTLRLRAERDGNLDGRVYLIIVTATNSSGNMIKCSQTVTVPKSQSSANKQSVAAQAAAAVAYYQASGAPPPGFVLVGDGPIVGKQ